MSESFWNVALSAAERGYAPDAVIRWGIRRLCAERLQDERSAGATSAEFADKMRQGPVAPVPEAANGQHYEVPPQFFLKALGPRLKYSCCYWPAGVETLAEAEEAALAESCKRAEIGQGQEILELGCGWGSLSLWMAEKYPTSQITALSNSAPQRRFIEGRAAERGLGNLTVVTCDMNDFTTESRFDRVVSIEMFEHMRNYEELLRRVSGWMLPSAKLFVHIFCHRNYAYEFETEGATHWLGRYFFTGGIMPDLGVFENFREDLRVARQWEWGGRHYERTANAWIENMDRAKAEILPILAAGYGASHAELWFQRWRIFFMACAELWGYAEGEEWLVGHYLLEPQSAENTEKNSEIGVSASSDAM